VRELGTASTVDEQPAERADNAPDPQANKRVDLHI
jgi:hypothetical protein